MHWIFYLQASSQMTPTILFPAPAFHHMIKWCDLLVYALLILYPSCLLQRTPRRRFWTRERISGGEESYRYVYILIWHAACWRPAGNLQKKVKKQKPVDEGHLISKPTGQAGRGSGFKLRPSMGLKKPHYNRLMVRISTSMRLYAHLLIIYPQRMTRFCANIFLDPRKSFQEQEKKRVEAVISYVSIVFFLHNSWINLLFRFEKLSTGSSTTVKAGQFAR